MATSEKTRAATVHSGVVPTIEASREPCKTCGGKATTAVWPAGSINPRMLKANPDYVKAKRPEFFCDEHKPSAAAVS